MWDLIRNDPILKSISILILGIFSFAFAFTIMFGAGQGQAGEHNHGSGAATVSSGYSAATGFGEIIIMLSKFLIIILLVAIIIAAGKFIKKYLIGNEPIKGIHHIKNKPFMTILISVGGILVLLLAMNLLQPANNTNDMLHSTAAVHNSAGGFGITGILTQVIKLIAFVSFVGLIVSLSMYVKDRYVGQVKAIALGVTESCNICGTELKASWNCCPSCGNVKNKSEVDKVNLEEDGSN